MTDSTECNNLTPREEKQHHEKYHGGDYRVESCIYCEEEA